MISMEARDMEKLIDRYWRRARREDAIREVPLLARFRDCESAGWTELPLYLIGYCLKPRIDWAHLNGEWLDTDGDGWAYCEVYDAPDPGEGYRLIDHTEKPMPGDEHFVNNWGWCWCGEHISGIPYTDDLLLRRPIRKPKPVPDPGEGWRLIDVDKETPKEGDQYFVHPSQWIDRADCRGCFKHDKFYRRRIEQSKPAPQYVPFTWEDREQLRGRWVVDSDGDEWCIIRLEQYQEVFLINGNPADEALEDWCFADTGEPVGRRVE